MYGPLCFIMFYNCVRLLIRHLTNFFLGKALFVPLAGAFCADSSVTDSSLRPLVEQSGLSAEGRRPGQICGHVFKSGELTYSCKYVTKVSDLLRFL